MYVFLQVLSSPIVYSMYTSLELLERTLLKTDAEAYLGTSDKKLYLHTVTDVQHV